MRNHAFIARLTAASCLLIIAAAATAAKAQTPIIEERKEVPATSKKPATPPPKPAAPAYTAPKLLWKTFLKRLDGTPAALGTVVWVGANNALVQIDSGGRTLWSTETGSQQSTPVYDDTRIFIGSDRNILYAMNRRSGEVAWQFKGESNGTISTRPTVGGGRVFTASSDGNIYGLDAASGALKWKFTRQDGSLGYANPVLFGSDALYCAGETTLYRLNPATGAETWRAFVGGKSLGTPTVAGGRVYVSGDGVGVNAFDEKDGKPLWSFTGVGKGDWFGPPLVSGGTVYVTTYSRYVYALDALSGKQKWSYRLLGNALATPALDTARNVLYVTSITFRDNPTITAIDSRTGKKLWDYRAGYVAGSPLLSGDRLYVGSTNGYLYAFSLK